jgi:hypothetical protein
MPEPPPARPAPKNSETARLRAEFDEVAALMDERHQEKERQQSRRDPFPARKPGTGLAAPGASSDPLAEEPEHVAVSSGLDLLV